MAFTKIVAAGINTGSSYTFQELNAVGIITAGTVQVGSATTIHTTGIDLGSGNVTSHNINSTGIITATSFVGPVTGNITGDITATSGTFSGNVSIGGTLTYEDVTNIDSVGIITARSDVNIENTAPTLNLIDTNGPTTASLLGNSGNIFYDTSSINRDHIFRGSTTEVVRITGNGLVGIGTDNPESALHVIGTIPNAPTKLGVHIGAHSGYGIMQFSAATGGIIDFGESGVDSAGRIIYTHSDDTLKLQTANTERLCIDSSGRFGLGLTPESFHSNNKSVIRGGGGYAILGRSDNLLAIAQNFYYDSSDAGKYIANGEASLYTQQDGEHRFFNAASGSANASASQVERLRITSDGKVGINSFSPDTNLEVSGGQNQTANVFTDLFRVSANANNDSIDAEMQLNIGISPSHTDTTNRQARIQSIQHSGDVRDLLLNPLGGRVAIGTDNPSAKLQVLSGNGDQLLLDNAGERFTQISLRNNGTQNGALWLDNTSNTVDLYANTNHGIRFKTGGDNERLRITHEGYMTKAPSGMMIRSGFYDTGTGSGARTQYAGTSWHTINVNGTGQVGHNIGKFSDDGLTYNKVSNNSHLNIQVCFPYYFDDSSANGGGFGIRGFFSTDEINYYTLSGLSEGPANGWGAGAYGGPEAGVFSYTWNTRMNSSRASTILAKTGLIRFYFQVRTWSGSSTIYIIDYSNDYPKKGSIIVQEIAE